MVLSRGTGVDVKNTLGSGNFGRVISVVAVIVNSGKLIKLPINVLPSKSPAESGDNPSLAKTIPNTPSCKMMMNKTDKRTK